MKTKFCNDVLNVDFEEKFLFRDEMYDTVRRCFYAVVLPSKRGVIMKANVKKLKQMHLDLGYFEVSDKDEIIKIIAEIVLSKCKSSKRYLEALIESKGIVWINGDVYLGERNNAYGFMIGFVRDVRYYNHELNDLKNLNECYERYVNTILRNEIKRKERKIIEDERKYFDANADNMVPFQNKYSFRTVKRGVLDAGEFID